VVVPEEAYAYWRVEVANVRAVRGTTVYTSPGSWTAGDFIVNTKAVKALLPAAVNGADTTVCNGPLVSADEFPRGVLAVDGSCVCWDPFVSNGEEEEADAGCVEREDVDDEERGKVLVGADDTVLLGEGCWGGAIHMYWWLEASMHVIFQ
jgi:hypothetical protein